MSVVRKGGVLYDQEAFVAEFGITPDLWTWVLALTGSHNGVPGIKGVGPKTALKAITSPDFTKVPRAIEYAAYIERNVPLIVLPHPDIPDTIMPKIEMTQPAERDLMRWLGMYGICLLYTSPSPRDS